MSWTNLSEARYEVPLDMTPMIDVVFQLVLFFVFSLKFVAFEGQIQAYIPRDRGTNETAPAEADPWTTTLELSWEEKDGGRVVARTGQYPSSRDGEVRDHQFPQERSREAAPAKPRRPESDFSAPRWDLVEEFLAGRKKQYEARSGGKDLPVTVSFDNRVPWQAVANVLDICARQKITNFALNMQEIEP